MAKNRTDELKFIKGVLTPLNPKDVYYINTEEVIKSYMGLILIGAILVFFFIVY